MQLSCIIFIYGNYKKNQIRRFTAAYFWANQWCSFSKRISGTASQWNEQNHCLPHSWTIGRWRHAPSFYRKRRVEMVCNVQRMFVLSSPGLTPSFSMPGLRQDRMFEHGCFDSFRPQSQSGFCGIINYRSMWGLSFLVLLDRDCNGFCIKNVWHSKLYFRPLLAMSKRTTKLSAIPDSPMFFILC